MSRKTFARGLPFLAVLAAQPAMGADPGPAPFRQVPWTFHLDLAQIRLPGLEEQLGLTGLSLLASTPSGFYLGPSLQAAFRGQRGGFFAGGIEGGLRAPLAGRLFLDGALFAGGGGGGGAPVGGGLMLRPRLGLIWQGQDYRLGLGVSQVRFPSGAILSTQPVFTVEKRFTTLDLAEASGTGNLLGRSGPLHLERSSFELKGSRHAGADGSPAMELGGLAWARPLDGPWFWQVEASAAGRGGSAGYMEVLGGVGGRVFLDSGRRFALRAVLGAGGGGGGGVGTGGGFLVKATGGLQLQVTPGVHVLAEAGRLEAPSTSFRTTTFALGTGFTLDSVLPGPGRGAPAREPSTLDWRLAAGVQRYGAVARSAGPPLPLEQFVFKAEVQASDTFYIVGQTGWGAWGGAGAWATAFLGLGAQTPGWHGQRLRVELLGGAGGGGGVASHGGALVQGLAGWNWDFSPSWSVHVMGGRVKAPEGGLSSSVLDLGLGFRGSKPVQFLN